MRHRDIARMTALAASLAIAAPAARAQRLGTPDLLARGVAAYDRLPERVTLRDAPVFSEALGYLFAYQQRALREGDRRVNAGASSALGWLLSSMAGMKAGKADEARSDDELRDRGMMMFDKARKSEQNGKIWDVPAFLSSSANLFAYIQVSSSPEQRVRAAHQWLVDAQSRLVASGVAADGYVNPEGWLPRGRRPGAKPSGAGGRAPRDRVRQRKK